jgi:hypothetical protein
MRSTTRFLFVKIGVVQINERIGAPMVAQIVTIAETKMDVGKHSYAFVCGLCKKDFTFSDGKLDRDLNPAPPKYCPLCGTKVVH